MTDSYDTPAIIPLPSGCRHALKHMPADFMPEQCLIYGRPTGHPLLKRITNAKLDEKFSRLRPDTTQEQHSGVSAAMPRRRFALARADETELEDVDDL